MKLFRSCFNSLFLKVISLAHDLSNVVCYPRSILASYSLRNRSSMKISDSLKILFSIFPTLRLDQVHCSKIVSSFKYVKISALKLLAILLKLPSFDNLRKYFFGYKSYYGR
jgi:hypothetical protein